MTDPKEFEPVNLTPNDFIAIKKGLIQNEAKPKIDLGLAMTPQPVPQSAPTFDEGEE